MALALCCASPTTTLSLSVSSSKCSAKLTTTPQSPPPLLKITNQHHHQANWSSLSSEIDTHILKSLPTSPPPAVADPMHLLISGAPPSVASALCLAACELVGGRRRRAMNAACAIQLVHAAAHARAQLLKNEHVVSPGVQLMTGDGILPLGYEMAARDDADHERTLRVIVEIARACGPQGLVEGQLLEAEGRGGPGWAWKRKGGRLSACGAACGAITGGGREEEVEKMRRFGWYVGMMNEMTTACSGGERERSYGEVMEEFRSLAMLELLGFDEGRVGEVAGLFL